MHYPEKHLQLVMIYQFGALSLTQWIVGLQKRNPNQKAVIKRKEKAKMKRAKRSTVITTRRRRTDENGSGTTKTRYLPALSYCFDILLQYNGWTLSVVLLQPHYV